MKKMNKTRGIVYAILSLVIIACLEALSYLVFQIGNGSELTRIVVKRQTSHRDLTSKVV